MHTTKRYLRFSDISTSEKVLNTVFLLTIGLAYLVALINMYFTHQGRDGKPGISIEDIVILYHGSPNQTRLGTAINGIMEPNLKYKTDKEVILRWINEGADEGGYQQQIAPILNRDCAHCHNPTVNPSLPDLTNFKTVSTVAHSGGAPLPTLFKVSHIHLFGIAFILYFIGRIFLLCDMNIYVKRIAVVLPFLAMLMDVMSWFITRWFPGFAYVVVLSGTLMGLSMGVQILLSIYQMWFNPKSTQTS